MKPESVLSVVLGGGLIVTGSFYTLPFMAAAYLFGLMLLGFGFEPRMHEDDMPMAKPAVKKAAKRRRKARSKA